METNITREEAIRRIKSWNLDSDDTEVLSVVIPELAESDDERIRKELIEFLREAYSRGNAPEECAKWLAYLEKQKDFKSPEEVLKIRQELYQSGYDDGYSHGKEDAEKQKEQKPTDLPAGFYFIDQEGNRYYSKELRYNNGTSTTTMKVKEEQKPNFDTHWENGSMVCKQKEQDPTAKINGELIPTENYSVDIPCIEEWSKEDQNALDNCCLVIGSVDTYYEPAFRQGLLNFLYSLPNRFSLPNKQWSEEEQVVIDCAVEVLEKELPSLAASLKSLRPPQYCENCKLKRSVENWKPSEEQIMALRYYLNHVPYSLHKEHLSSLRDDLEKLM